MCDACIIYGECEEVRFQRPDGDIEYKTRCWVDEYNCTLEEDDEGEVWVHPSYAEERAWKKFPDGPSAPAARNGAKPKKPRWQPRAWRNATK